MQNMKDVSNSHTTITCWVEAYSDNLYSWALHKTSSKEVAEDLVQETFLAAVQAFEKFEGKSQPKSWLIGILNNKIADYHRKNMRNPKTNISDNDKFFDKGENWLDNQVPLSWHTEEIHLLDNPDFHQSLQNCMEKLPASWASAIHLKYLDEKKAEDICQELGISNTNYWQVLHRAKLQLRKCIELNWYKK